jgi:hypothetical protein
MKALIEYKFLSHHEAFYAVVELAHGRRCGQFFASPPWQCRGLLLPSLVGDVGCSSPT